MVYPRPHPVPAGTGNPRGLPGIDPPNPLYSCDISVGRAIEIDMNLSLCVGSSRSSSPPNSNFKFVCSLSSKVYFQQAQMFKASLPEFQ